MSGGTKMHYVNKELEKEIISFNPQNCNISNLTNLFGNSIMLTTCCLAPIGNIKHAVLFIERKR